MLHMLYDNYFNGSNMIKWSIASCVDTKSQLILVVQDDFDLVTKKNSYFALHKSFIAMQNLLKYAITAHFT